jgi:hypothetical protein
VVLLQSVARVTMNNVVLKDTLIYLLLGSELLRLCLIPEYIHFVLLDTFFYNIAARLLITSANQL